MDFNLEIFVSVFFAILAAKSFLGIFSYVRGYLFGVAGAANREFKGTAKLAGKTL